MMRIMREKPVFVLGVIVFVVAVFVGSIFVVYGLKSGGSGGGPSQGSVVAVVEGEEIPYSEYLNNYNNQIDFYRQFYPTLGLKDLEERFQLKEKALESMINTRLLIAEAARMGIKVSDEEVRSKIEKTPLFQEGGRFDPAKYRQILSSSRVVPAAYEEGQRSELLVGKVRDIIRETVKVTEEEAWEAYRREKDTVGLTLLALPADSYRGWVSTTPDELKEEYARDPEKYRRPERLKVAYLTVDSAEIERDLVPDEDALRDFYEENADRWRTPPQVRARHILIKVPGDASAEREKELRERADFVLGKAREGADFTALAKEFSQDSTGPGGGDLGWFGRGQMVPPFEEAAFSLQPGEISDVVKTQFGFHVIKVEEVREAGERPFEEVREEVKKEFLRLEVRRLASEKADEISDELYDEDFEKVAAAHGLEVRRAERLTKDDILPGLGYRPEITESLFDLDEGQISEIYRQDGSFYIFKIEGRTASYVPEFEEAEAEVRADLEGEKAMSKAKEEAGNMLAKLRSGETMEEAAATVKGKLVVTPPFSRGGVVPEAGVPGDTFSAAFSQAVKEYGGPVSSDGKVWIYRVVEVNPATREGFADEKAAITDRLLDEKKDIAFQSWVEDLRRIRSVQVDETLMGSTGD